MPTRKTLAFLLALALAFAIWRLLYLPPTASISDEDQIDAQSSSLDIVMNGSLDSDRGDPDYNKIVAEWKTDAKNDVEMAVIVLVLGTGAIVYLLATSDRLLFADDV